MGVLNDYANAAAVNAALNKGVEASKAVSELKEDLVNYDKADLLPLGLIKTSNGLPTMNNTWNVDGDKFKHVVIPVNGGEHIELIGVQSPYTYWGVLIEYTQPVNGASVSFSSDVSFNKRIVTGLSIYSNTLPTDAKYLMIVVNYNGTDTTPTKLTIDGLDYLSTIRKALGSVVSNVLKEVDNATKKLGIKFLSDFEKHNGNASTVSAIWNYINSDYQHVVIPIKSGDNIKFTANNNNLVYGLLSAYTTPTDGGSVSYATGYTKAVQCGSNDTLSIVAPNDAKYLIMVVTRNNVDCTPVNLSVNGYDYTSTLFDILSDKKSVKWCAMGDSITEGYVSFRNASGSRTSASQPQYSWVRQVAKYKGFEVDNKGIGGTGWNRPTNTQVSAGTDTTSAWYVATHNDYSDFDLVTLAYGINDWKSNLDMGDISDDFVYDNKPNTVISGMRKTIEAIIRSNPKAKIIGILPLNCLGYYTGESLTSDNPIPTYGTLETNYGLGYSFVKTGTLEQFVQKLISVYDYYGIEYIDQTHYSCVNRMNIIDTLIDGVHPSKDTHIQLAHELASKINFS